MKSIGNKTMLFCGITMMLTVGAVGETSPSESKAAWRGKMRELSQAFAQIIPDLFTVENSKEQIANLKTKTEKLYSVVTGIDPTLGHAAKAPDNDPALPYIAQQLRENVQRANESLKEGHNEYAKSLLRSSVSYCIACHTRSQTGVQFPLLSAFSEPLKKASWIDQISFEAASRQFDPVYQSVMKQLEPKFNSDLAPFDLERGARIALSICIRVKQSPEQAIALARSILRAPQANAGLKEDALVWVGDLLEWQRESSRKYSSDTQLVLAARKLIRAKEGGGPIWTPHSEVKFLRASLLMHDLFRDYPNSPLTGEALYIIGVSYDQLRDLGLWSLQDIYFQACIKKSPHTKIAEQCYERYQNSVAFGFTGSGGTSIPGDVARELKSLRALSARSSQK